MRRRIWLVADAALKMSTALLHRDKDKITQLQVIASLWQHYFGKSCSPNNMGRKTVTAYRLLVTPSKLSPFTSRIWSPGIRFPVREQKKSMSHEHCAEWRYQLGEVFIWCNCVESGGKTLLTSFLFSDRRHILCCITDILLEVGKVYGKLSPNVQRAVIQSTFVKLLRSEQAGMLAFPKNRTKSFGNRAFFYHAPFLWNKSSAPIKEAVSLAISKSGMRAHLFSLYIDCG